jgi:hypothetical protein
MKRLLLAGLALAASARAFYQNDWLDLRLDSQGGLLIQSNPPTEFSYPSVDSSVFPPKIVQSKQAFYPWPDGNAEALELRLLGKAGIEKFDFHFNLDFEGQRRDRIDSPFISVPPLDHRSRISRLGEQDADGQGSSDTWFLDLDQAFLQAKPFESLSLSIGRQPINWASNYYFSPNDLFAPFAPDDFLRIYKPGVDALRATLSLSQLSQAELVWAMGYGPARQFEGQRAVDEPLWTLPSQRKAALLGRLHADLGGLELGGIVGWDADRDLEGLELQWELLRGWLINFEGNESRFDDDPGRFWTDVSLGLSDQFNAELNLRLEIAEEPSAPLCPACSQSLEREERPLSALGLTWQAHPLLSLGFFNLADLDRWEGLLGTNAQISISNEADLILSGEAPWRFPKERGPYATAFELAPLSLKLQLRWVL